MNAVTNGGRRVRWVDTARGVAMSLVFFGHLGEHWFPALSQVIGAIYTFHMPLFFLLSGLFFKPTISFRELVVKRSRTLLVPYYIFSILAIIGPAVKLVWPTLYAAVGKSVTVDLLPIIVGILLAQGESGLWFLWSLFVALCCLWVLVRITHGSRWRLLLLLGAFIVLDFIVSQTPFADLLPFQLGKLFKSTAYVGFGYLVASRADLGRVEDWSMAKKSTRALVVVVAFLSTIVLLGSGDSLDNPTRSVVQFATTLMGIASAILVSLLIPAGSFLSTIGTFSLTFYCLNDIVLKVVKFFLFSVAHIPIASLHFYAQLSIGFVTVLIALVICYFLNALILRKAPWAIGIPGGNRPALDSGRLGV